MTIEPGVRLRWTIAELPMRGALFNGAIDAYSAAFSMPPYSDPMRAHEVRERMAYEHAGRSGFRAHCAVIPGNEVAGMIYGFHSERGQPWHDHVAWKLGFGPSRNWLSNAYELAELAVMPAYQGEGIGSALIERLLRGRPERTCLLSTRCDSRANELYARVGFETLGRMTFRENGADYYVMGRRLR